MRPISSLQDILFIKQIFANNNIEMEQCPSVYGSCEKINHYE